jgi:hypothetical protein
VVELIVREISIKRIAGKSEGKIVARVVAPEVKILGNIAWYADVSRSLA